MGQLCLLNINMDENIYKSIVQHIHNNETLRSAEEHLREFMLACKQQ